MAESLTWKESNLRGMDQKLEPRTMSIVFNT